MAKASQIVNKALSYVGTAESPPYSNNVIFNTDYYGAPVYGEYPWCMAFVWDIFRMCDASNLFYDGQKTAYCPALMSWAQSIGKFVYGEYKPGDVLFFNFKGLNEADHTGICVSDNGSYLITVEGNTSSDDYGSQDNGGEVAKKTRYKNVIIGAYRPDFEPEAESGWKQDSIGWWYVKEDGTYYQSEWATINGKDYYFKADGYMASDEYIKSADYANNKILYYVNKDGDWNNKTYRWNSNEKGWWLEARESSWYAKSEWATVDFKKYYFDKTGYMVTGTKTINGKTYIFDDDGALIGEKIQMKKYKNKNFK